MMRYLIILGFISISFAVVGQTASQFHKRIESLILQENYYEGLDYLNSVLMNTPSCAWCHSYKVSIYMKIGNDNLCQESIKAGIDINDSTVLDRLLSQRGILYLKNFDIPEAYDDFKSAYAINKSNNYALSSLGLIEAFYLRKYEAGTEKIKQAYLTDDPDPFIHLNYARLLVVEKRYQEALVLFRQYKHRAKEIPPLNYYLGECHMQLKSYDSAMHYFKLARINGPVEMKKEVDYLIEGIKSLPQYKN